MERSFTTDQYRLLPSQSGVYLFKDAEGTVLYIGKAKNLKKRVASYFAQRSEESKADEITAASSTIDHIITKNEIEAMLLEAKLIKNYQPRFNVLLKSGQPYLYLLFSTGPMPTLKLVRNKKQKGKYFGPILEKGSARRVYNFFIKTFRLKLCKKGYHPTSHLAQGCLYYHMGICAGSCRKDFDQAAYHFRLDLAQQALEKGYKKFLKELKKQIDLSNKTLAFEKSKELYGYYHAFEKVFLTLQTNFAYKEKSLAHKHIWIIDREGKTIFLFDEINGTTKKKLEHKATPRILEQYYQTHDSPQTILTNFPLENRKIIEQFLKKWHKKRYPVSIISQPAAGHLFNLVNLATVHATTELEKKQNLGAALQALLKLPKEPRTIDCFDISHRQGMGMVGSSIRFKDGKPDKNKFRKFKIKTVDQQDDYACLREVVSRRYRDPTQLPDLILIDGGKGQLNAVKNLFPQAEWASLAKREERLFSKRLKNGRKIEVKTIEGQLLIAMRDYAHHFAIQYHRLSLTFSSFLRTITVISFLYQSLGKG